MVIVWVVIAAALVAVEMHHLAFYAMFAAAGALAAALVAVLAPSVVPLQIGVGIGVAAAGILLVRPYVSRAFAPRGPGARIGGVHGGLVASRGITLDDVTSEPVGHVRILGERWLAVAWEGQPIQPQTPVIVMDVTGTTLTVRAAEQPWELT
ncbi:MAG: NfeD family protein [Actinomycetota bacterium]|nr:NfeD family protein [Actinomycetota bacterium]